MSHGNEPYKFFVGLFVCDGAACKISVAVLQLCIICICSLNNV